MSGGVKRGDGGGEERSVNYLFSRQRRGEEEEGNRKTDVAVISARRGPAAAAAAPAIAAGGDDGRTEEADGAFHPLPSSSSSSSRLAQTNNRCQLVSERRVTAPQWLLSVSSGSSGSTHFTLFVWRKTCLFVVVGFSFPAAAALIRIFCLWKRVRFTRFILELV